MSFTPVSWLAEQFSRVRVGGRELGERVPTENVPAPILKAAFWVIIAVLFVDEFLILAAMFGGPIALVLLLGFAVAVYAARKTDRGRRAKQRVSSRLTRGSSGRRAAGYDTRQNDRK